VRVRSWRAIGMASVEFFDPIWTFADAWDDEGDIMIKELTDLPAGVIGFETSGKLQAEDYRDVLLPALERAAKPARSGS
jgi:hypothetical protein